MTEGPEVTAELVRDLLRDQHPDLADRPIALGARGWDNQLWRLGDDLAVRLPWATPTADELLLHEYTWVPGIASRLPLPVPVPQRLGVPSPRFPRPWVVTTWVAGSPADHAPVTRGDESARALAGFLTALHRPAPDAAPAGRGRGGSLVDHTADGALDRFRDGYRPTVDDATWRRARGCAVGRALVCLLIGDAGVHGRPGGKSTWGPSARGALRRITGPGARRDRTGGPPGRA